MTMDTARLTCDGCGFEVSTPDAHQVATAFGWQIGQTAIGEEEECLCPVCVEKNKARVSSLVVATHIRQPQGHAPKARPVPKHPLFAANGTKAVNPETKKKQLVEHLRAAVNIVAEHIKPTDSLSWAEHEKSTWMVVIHRRSMLEPAAEVQE